MNRRQRNLIPDDGSSMFLQNIGPYIPGYSASLFNYKIVILVFTATEGIVFQDSSNGVKTSSVSVTHNPDSAHATQQELKHSSTLPYQGFKTDTCQSPCSVMHKEELPTQTDEAPDISAQSQVTSDSIWLSQQDEEVTCSTKPQYVNTLNVISLLLGSCQLAVFTVSGCSV
jgi:hypothetical protein